jgi:hypothetical protein
VSDGVRIVIKRSVWNDWENAKPESRPESLENRVISIIKEHPSSKSEIAEKLGQKEIAGQLNKIIRMLMSESRIEYTIPEKPNSRLQKYRIKG